MRNMRIFINILLLLICSSCCSKFPSYKSNSCYRVVVADGVESKVYAPSRDEDLMLQDNSSNEFIFLREGKKPTFCDDLHFPRKMQSIECNKFLVIIDHNSFSNYAIDEFEKKMDTIRVFSNIILDKFMFGLKIELEFASSTNHTELINSSPENPVSESMLDPNVSGYIIVKDNWSEMVTASHSKVGKHTVIYTDGNLLNGILFTHEILHRYLYDTETDENDIMFLTAAYSERKFCTYNQLCSSLQHSSIIFSSEQTHDGCTESNTDEIMRSANMILRTIGNTVKYDPFYDDSTQIHLPNLIHPFTITPDTNGFDDDITLYSEELISKNLSPEVENFFSEIYSKEYTHFKQEQKFKIPFLSSSSVLDHDRYVAISLENIKNLRQTNILVWLAQRIRSDSNPSVTNQIVSEINSRGSSELKAKWQRIKSAYKI